MPRVLLALLISISQLLAQAGAGRYACIHPDGSACCIDHGDELCSCQHECSHDEPQAETSDCCHDCDEDDGAESALHQVSAAPKSCVHVPLGVDGATRGRVHRAPESSDWQMMAALPCVDSAVLASSLRSHSLSDFASPSSGPQRAQTTAILRC